MTVKIENTTRTVPVIVAKIPVSLIGAEDKMLAVVDDLSARALPHAVYNIELCLYEGSTLGFKRTSFSIGAEHMKEQLTMAIKGHPDGYPAGMWPVVADIKSSTTEVRISLIEVLT